MLNGIKKMIKSRQSMMEAASLLMEAGAGIDDILLDDSIVLGEKKEDETTTPDPTPVPEENKEETPADSATTPEENPAPDGTETPELPDDPDGDLNDPTAVPQGDGITPETDPAPEGEPAPAETSTEEPLPVPGDSSDDLPDVVGAQTGEPPIDSDDDLMSVELDIGSNTLKDVLPTPPDNAGEAIGDDLMSATIDDGFGGDSDPAPAPAPAGPEPVAPEAGIEESDDLMSAPLDAPEETPALESVEPVTEAITLGDDAPAADANADQPAAEPAADPTGVVPDADVAPDAAPAEGDNEVTAAVKDKVSDMDAGVEDDDGPASNEDLLKKLSNITKNLEDIKKGLIGGGSV